MPRGDRKKQQLLEPTLFDVTDYHVEPEPDDFDTNGYETPDAVVGTIVPIILSPNDARVLEPGAGRGQFAKRLPPGTVCIELEPERYETGRVIAPHCDWSHANFLQAELPPTFDLVIGNPPFDVGMQFLAKSLTLLNPQNPNARVVFLLPNDYFSAKGRGEMFHKLDCYIVQTFDLIGRVSYIKNGVPVDGRQVCDSIFVFRPGHCSWAGRIPLFFI